MKYTRWIPFSVIACLALFAGQWTGRSVMRWTGKYAPEPVGLAAGQVSSVENTAGKPADFPTPTSEQPLPPLPQGHPVETQQNATHAQVANRQENILFIGVNNLTTPNPRLLSAWLIIYLNDKSHFMLLPIYPAQTPAAQSTQPEESIADHFFITADGALGEAFIQDLQAREVWWTGVVVMDQKAVASLLDYAAGNNYASGADMLDNLPDPGRDPLNALMEQARLARSLCLSTGQLTRGELWKVSRFYSTIREHVRTDIDVASALADWEGRLKRGNLTCEFPSLATALMLP